MTTTNRLANETSPYLLQHAHNPVDWYAWSDEAFAKARGEDKPIFLSIGYSACHWCHVMERESFENEEIAAILNREFVSIKVDREERPDVDSIYMQAVQMMTGHGGWPMSMFLTPEGVPYYAGTYFPPDDGRGMPGFKRVLRHVADAYRTRREEVTAASEEIRTALQSAMNVAASPAAVTREGLDAAALAIGRSFDPVHGGLGGAPKFPPSMTLDFLMQVAARTRSVELSHMVHLTLEKMARGGLYDQIGGGFHRYSVDARWLAPHFEKMLYDNALLVRLYTRAWQWSKDPLCMRVAKETLGFVAREMTSPQGGFYSTLDADSEGEEGKFYVWSREEILRELGDEEGRIFSALYDVSDGGNWEGKNILNMPRDPEVVAADIGVSMERLTDIASRGKCHLHGARAKRVPPGRDEKILAGWNGWMLAALGEAAVAFGDESLVTATRNSADFLISTMMEGSRIYRSYKDGRRKIGGLLEDYSGAAWGLLSAFEATREMRYLRAARELAGEIVVRFADADSNGLFDTPDDHEALITRPRDLFDNATPSGSSVAIVVLSKLALYLNEPDLERRARAALESIWPVAQRYPSGFGFLLGAAEGMTGRPKEIVVTGAEDEPAVAALWRAIGEAYLPHRVMASSATPELPLLEGKPLDRVAGWICEGYQCLEPVDDPQELRRLLDERR
ncbi:MAG TPA: thioredoxin domain-containing protein [Thermoanaerobaculia bacterium]|nr:thioredoxin domain-containing protein [Thermoanaerobaculia bacterium]